MNVYKRVAFDITMLNFYSYILARVFQFGSVNLKRKITSLKPEWVTTFKHIFSSLLELSLQYREAPLQSL